MLSMHSKFKKAIIQESLVFKHMFSKSWYFKILLDNSHARKNIIAIRVKILIPATTARQLGTSRGVYTYPAHLPWVGCHTKPIYKQSITDLNSKFSFY